MTPSETILAENAAVLDRMLAHPFVAGITDGTLPAPAYHRYLVYEAAFVETAIAIFAHATIRAPDLAAKRWLIEVQQALATDQMRYFEDSFDALGIDPDIPLPPDVTAFDSGMLQIAETGDFLDIVTAMFAAEWMYWTWCRRAAATPSPDPHIRAWVDLHAAPAFEAQARWLKDTLDRHVRPADLPRLSAIFAQVTELEIAFHNAPLEGDTDA